MIYVVFFSIYERRTMGATFHQKIIWLQKFYCDYSIEWYSKRPQRTEAIYQREYNKFQDRKLNEVAKKIKEERRMELDERSSFYNQLSLQHYGCKLTELNFKELKKLFENF